MANEAETVAVELIAKNGDFDIKMRKSADAFGGSMDTIEKSAGKAEKAIDELVAAQKAGQPITAKMIQDAGGLAKAEAALAASLKQTAISANTSSVALNKAGLSAKQMAQQSRLLGYQIADVGQGLAIGTSPFIILAQQGGQVANALEGSRGKLGQFARFLSGPYGAAVLAGTAALGLFISRNMDATESVDDLVEALKKKVREAENADKAQAEFGDTIEGVTKALKDNQEAIDKLNKAEKTSAEEAYKTAEAQRVKAIKIRETTVALLQQAKVEFEFAENPLNSGDSTSAANKASAAIREVQRLDALLIEAEESLATARSQVVQARAAVIVEQATASVEDKINKKYDLQIDKARKAAIASGTVETALRKEIRAIEAARDAEISRAKEAEKAARKKTTGLPNVTGKEIAAALGAPITSGKRSAAQNKAVGGGANSFHLSGQAIDIPLTVNGKPLTKAGIRAALEPMGVVIKELLGPGDKDHNDHFHIAFDKKRIGADKIAENQQKEADALERARISEERRRQSFENELAQLADSEISARQALITNVEEIAKLELESIEISRQRYDDNLKSLVDQKKLTDEEAGELRAINEERAKLRAELVKRREDERKFRMQEAELRRNAEFSSEVRADEGDLLASQLDLARTQKQRRDLELRLLDLQFREERARNDYLIGYYDRLKVQEGITESELSEAKAAAEIAELRNASLEERRTNAEQGTERATAGPIQSFLQDIPSTADEINEALENVAAGGLATFTDALTDAIVNFRSLGDVGLAVLRSITASLVKMAIQQIILRTIGQTAGNAAVAATGAQAATTAAAWAPAAALASLATLGANAGPASVALATTTALAAALAATSSAAGLKDGGPVIGPGGPTDDKVPLYGSNGEYMIKAKSVSKLGRANLDRMNLTGELPIGFAMGGPVGGLIMPSNAPASRQGGSGSASLDENSLMRLAQIVSEAAGAMPDIKLFPTLDPGTAFLAGLNSPGGSRGFFEFMTSNSGQFKAAANS